MTTETGRIRVLVIDGSRNVRDFVAEQVLSPNGHTPILAGDGAEGLRSALSELPDLILMDYELPIMSGRDVLEALHSRTLQIPIILMIPSGFEQLAVPLMRKGVRDFLVKPFSAKELLESMRRVVSEVQLRRGETDLEDQLAQARQRIRQALIEQHIFHGIGRSVTAPVPLSALLGRITDAALFVTGSEECVLMLKDPQTGRLRQHVKRCPQGAVQPLVSRAGPHVDQPGAIVAMLHIPLKVGRRVMGVLAVMNRTTPRSFNEHERQMLQILADFAAIAIEYVRLMRQVHQTGKRGSDSAAHD